MRVALVLPPNWTIRTPHLGIAYLASALEASGHTVKVFDFNFAANQTLKEAKNGAALSGSMDVLFSCDELFDSFLAPLIGDSMRKHCKQIVDWRPDVIGFTIYYSSTTSARKMARLCKEGLPGVKVIYGGPTFNPSNEDFTLELNRGHVDAIVMGEGEETMVEILRRWENEESLSGCEGVCHLNGLGKIVIEPVRKPLDLDSLAWPNFDHFDVEKFEFKRIPFAISRGCVAKCTFCEETRYWPRFRYRNPESAFEEIKFQVHRYDTNSIEFNDSLINGNFKQLDILMNLMAKLDRKLDWNAYARLDARMNRDLLRLMKRSGCSALRYGFESGSQKVVDLMEKRTQIETTKRIVRETYEAGIDVKLQVVVGFPGETEVEFNETVNFLNDNAKYIKGVFVAEMQVLPLLPMYRQPEKYGIKSSTISKLGHLWEAEDGTNTPMIRKQRRAKIEETIGVHGFEARWQ